LNRVVLLGPLLIFSVASCFSLRDVGTPLVLDTLYISRSLGPFYRNNLAADPSISIHFVPTPGHYTVHDLGMDLRMLNRLMRIYMPRSYDYLVKHFDVVIMYEAPCSLAQYPQVYFEPKWMSWLVRGVQQEGMYLTMWHGDASWGGGREGPWLYGSWGETIVGQILPFECFGGEDATWYGRFRPQITDPDHPLAKLPWSRNLLFEEMKKVEPKLGAAEVARAVELGSGQTYPWIAWWRTGRGKVLGEAAGAWESPLVEPWLRWRWYQDFLVYLVYMAADKPIPSDIYLVHRLREEINGYLARTSLVSSVLDFAERFGANTVKLRVELEQINLKEKTAENYYRTGQYDETSRLFEEIYSALEELSSKAAEVKDKALFWVYLAEWLAITATSLISGFVLWSLMVRRKLYREVAITRGESGGA